MALRLSDPGFRPKRTLSRWSLHHYTLAAASHATTHHSKGGEHVFETIGGSIRSGSHRGASGVHNLLFSRKEFMYDVYISKSLGVGMDCTYQNKWINHRFQRPYSLVSQTHFSRLKLLRRQLSAKIRGNSLPSINLTHELDLHPSSFPFPLPFPFRSPPTVSPRVSLHPTPQQARRRRTPFHLSLPQRHIK